MAKETMTVRIACDVKERIEIDDLVPMQGKLKVLPEEEYQKLRNEILDTGFAFPFYLWRNPRTKKFGLIGGHQRLAACSRMREEGVLIPELPYVVVHAKDEKEARRRILQDISQYGQVTSAGLVEFSKHSGFNLQGIADSFRMPDVNIDFLIRAQLNVPPRKVEFNVKDKATNPEVKDGQHECPRCGCIFD
jgi:hypothetical protein